MEFFWGEKLIFRINKLSFANFFIVEINWKYQNFPSLPLPIHNHFRVPSITHVTSSVSFLKLIIALMLSECNRKMCYGSWNYGSFQFSFFFKSHIITHQKQRHILYFLLHETHSTKVTKLEINFFFLHHCHTHNVKVTSQEQKSEICKSKKQKSWGK